MEAKCRKCEEYFPRQKILVAQDGLYCEGCVADDAIPFVFQFTISWQGINALLDYIDGERDLDTLLTIDKFSENIKKNIITRLKVALNGDIQESD